jgi:hypothetical protein
MKEKLCGVKIKISKRLNVENHIEVSCDLYEGHLGPHSKIFYHTRLIEGARFDHERINLRVGKIDWERT